MPGYNESGKITLTADVALTKGLGVYIDSAGEAALTAAGTAPIGVVERDTEAGDPAPVWLYSRTGTHEIQVDAAIAAYTFVYTAATGLFTATAIGKPAYMTLEASSAANELVEAIPVPAAWQDGFASVLHSTASFTLTKYQAGAVITNLGASGAVTVTLPQDAPKGTRFFFNVMAAQELRIDPGAAGAVYINGAKQTDDKYISADDEAEHVTLTADGNGDWIAGPYNGTWTVEA